MTAWVSTTLVAFATDQVRSTSADVPTSLKETATATETSLTRSAYVVETAQRMPMPMESVTTWTTAWVSTTLAAYATAQEKSTSADVQTSQKVTATVMATSLTPWAYAVVTARQMPMATAFVMMPRYLGV